MKLLLQIMILKILIKLSLNLIRKNNKNSLLIIQRMTKIYNYLFQPRPQSITIKILNSLRSINKYNLLKFSSFNLNIIYYSHFKKIKLLSYNLQNMSIKSILNYNKIISKVFRHKLIKVRRNCVNPNSLNPKKLIYQGIKNLKINS